MTCRVASCVLCSIYAARGFDLPAPYAYNAASYSSALAPGSIIGLSYSGGSNVRDAGLIRVRVQPEGSTQVFACRVLLTSPLWAVLPAEVPTGPANITLAIDGQVFAPTPVALTASAPGLFSVNQFTGGAGGLAQNLDSLGVPSLNQLTNPALAGQYVTLWATGLGDRTTGDVTVDLAGERISAAFAGHSPEIPGMDQVNFRIPADAFDGCYVPVKLRAGGSISNQVTIAKAAAAGSCVHPLGLSAIEEKALDGGGSIPFGSVSVSGGVAPSLDPSIPGYYRFESLVGNFVPAFAGDIAQLAGPQSPGSGYPACQLDSGAIVGQLNGFLLGPTNGSLVLNGPAGQHLEAVGDNGRYSLPFSGASTAPASSPDQLPPSVFSAGAWTLSLTGDSTIRPFQQTLQLPPPLNWTNRASFTTISRAGDAVITWDPAGYSATDVSNITLNAASGAVTCQVPAKAGSVTLVSSMLEELAPTANGLLSVQISSSPRDSQRFTVTTSAGSMPVVFGYGFGETLWVVIK